MSRKYFGTDGIRGTVGQDPLTAEFALRLASAAARVLAPDGGTVAIGKDTRLVLTTESDFLGLLKSLPAAPLAEPATVGINIDSLRYGKFCARLLDVIPKREGISSQEFRVDNLPSILY